jgi:hypothetical protein
MRNAIRFFSVALAAGLLMPLAAGIAAQEPPAGLKCPDDPALLRSLVNSPKALTCTVRPVMRAGKVWCDSQADFHAVFRSPLEPLARILRNHEDYPRYFPRITANRVRRDGDLVEQTQTLTISLLGVRYQSVYGLTGSDRLFNNPPRLYNEWVQSASDGSVQAISGSWYLEEITLTGEVMTYVRYRTRSEVPETIPGQATLMGYLLGNDICEAIMDVARALKQR